MGRIGDGGAEVRESDVQYSPVKASDAAMYLSSETSTSFDNEISLGAQSCVICE